MSTLASARRPAAAALAVVASLGLALVAAAARAQDAVPPDAPPAGVPTLPATVPPPPGTPGGEQDGPYRQLLVRPPLRFPAHLNAVRLDLRVAANNVEVGYERALTRRIGVFGGVTLPFAYAVPYTAGSVAGQAFGGTLGARFYVAGGSGPMSGLTLSPFVDLSYLRLLHPFGSGGKTAAFVYGAGGTVGYSWTPGDAAVLHVGVGVQYLQVNKLSVAFPTVTFGVGPTF